MRRAQDGATQIRENQEKVFAHGVWMDNNLKSFNQREVTAVLKTLLKFRQELIQLRLIGIQLLIDNTVTMYCLDKGKDSITIALLVDKILKPTLTYLLHARTDNERGIVISPKTKNQQEGQESANFNCSFDYITKAQSEVVYRAERKCNAEDMLWREYASLINGSETQKQGLGAATWIDLPFFSGSKDRKKLFRQLLQARGLSSNAVDRVISNWSSQWRTHISGCTLPARYLKRIHQQPEYFLNLEQPQSFMGIYLEDAINQKYLDNSVKNLLYALVVLLKFIGYSEQQIHSDPVKQLMRKIRMRLRQIDKEKQILDLDILLDYVKSQVPLLEQNLLTIQQRRAIAATLLIVFTIAKLAELHRAALLSTSDDEFARLLMRESAHCAGSNPGLLTEDQISEIKPKNSGGSAMQIDISRLMILAKLQEQQRNLLALARLTQKPPLELHKLPKSQNKKLLVCKLIGSFTTLTLPPQQGNTITRTITLKLEKCLARQKKNSTMKKKKNKREHYQKRSNMRDPISNREYQALMGFFLQA
ncbi:MAG: hypothetical protein EZS28_030175 [Streblomastix strix]|uniref:Uncharacterized protein n=1 Tax=Streblomastix strix TaxID=222440 RepID=A0A5J4UV27_9EUKA|nr:MAG: hypothetical protein EZS28_030175 [Streblomastix strix]